MKALLLGLFLFLFSNFTFGQTLYTFNGGGTSGSWEDPSVWTTDPTGSTSVGARVPGSTNNVVITNSFVVTLSTTLGAAATPASITVQRGGVLDLVTTTAAPVTSGGFSGTLGRLAGQGTLRIGRPYFPAVTTNDFDDANTGTVEFYNWPAGPTALPTAVGQYNNLRLLNTTATAYTAQLNNDLTLKGNLTLVNATYVRPVPPATAPAPTVVLNLGQTAGTNRALTIDGNVTVGVGTSLGVTAVAGAHTINVSGSFVNNGTVNLHNGVDTQAALLNFTGATDANFACNGPTDLGRLQVNKGIDSQTLLNVTATVAPGGASASNLRLNYIADGALLVLINGVAKLGGNIFLPKIRNGNTPGIGFDIGTPSTGPTNSGTSPTLWIAGATLQNNNATGVVVYGTYRISAGQFNSLTPDAMVIREDGQVLVEGGKTFLNKMRPSSTTATHRGSFIITGGEFECNGTNGTANDGFARFAIPYLTQSFRMTGGTIRVQNPSALDGLFHIGANPNNAVVTGGTIEVILPATNENGRILTTAPLWNLTIRKAGAAGTSKAILADVPVPATFAPGATTTAQPLTMLNNFTIDGTNPTTFDANSQNINIQGTFTIGTGGIYLPTTNTTTFSGGQNQLLTNNGAIGTANNTFYNWTVNKSAGTLTLGGTAGTYTVAAAGTLSLLNGVLNDGGKTVNVLGNLVNSASHTSGGGTGSIVLAGTGAQTVSGNGEGVFGNLSVGPRAAGAVTMTANMSVASVLTLNHVLDIGANRLSLTNVSPGAVTTNQEAFSNLYMIRTAGNQSDLGVQKTYGGAESFLFPVGTGTKYTPAIIRLALATSLSRYGQVSVSPTNMRNPFVTGTTNSLAYYWKVRSVGFDALPTGSIFQTFRMINADAVGTRANYIPARYLPVAWTTYNDPNLVTDAGATSNTIAFEALDQFEGEFTAGEPAAFGAVTAFYSRANGNWETPTTWSTTGFTGAAATTVPGAGNPVFIGSASDARFHTVTVTAINAKSGSLVIDRGSVLDVQTFTGHNFGALPDAKIGGAGRLRVSTSSNTITVFPGGDFGSFLQPSGGTVEYYTTSNRDIIVPLTSASGLALNSYRNLWLNAGTGRMITLPNVDLRVYAQLKAGTVTTFPGTALLSGGTAGNLRVDSLLAVQAGVLRFANGTARTLIADTDVRVDAGATFDTNGGGATVTNALTVGGSLTNNGILDFNMTSKASLTFTGLANTSLTGTTGTLTDLFSLTVNKGTNQTPTLTVDVAGALTTPTNGWLTLSNGTLRYAKANSTLTIHDAASPYIITDNAALTVDATGANVTVATNTSALSDLKLAGQLRVLQGMLSVGTAAGTGNDLEYASAGAPTIRVSGTGTLYVNGQVRRTTANTNGSLRYDQSGGAVEVAGLGATAAANNERALFEVQGPGSIFRMTGGTLALRRSNGRPAIIADLYLRPDSTVVTAGTVLLGNTAAGVGNVTISVESLVPLYDLRVEAGASNTNQNTGLLTGLNPLNLKGSLTIGNDNSFFRANGLGLNIDQDLINNNTSTSTSTATVPGVGGFQPGTPAQTTTFTGKGAVTQLLAGAAGNLTEFGSLLLNNARPGGTLRLDRNARVIGTLTLTKGTLADNAQTITALGDVINSATHTSSGTGSLIFGGTANQNIGGNDTGRFGNLTLSNVAGATTLANQEVTGQLTLTGGVLTIGSNLLWLSNPGISAVAGILDATRHIRTNGIVADLGLRKSYPATAHNFVFPMGASGKYTPVRMNVTSNSAVGTITVRPIDRAHPSTTDAAFKELSYFWKVSSTGFSAAPAVTQDFTYVDVAAGNDVNGTEASYKLGRFLNGAWTPVGGIAGSTVNATSNTLTAGVTYFEGDYTGGEPSEFGVVPTFYSRNATAGLPAGANWNDPAAWTSNADGTDSSPLLTTFPTLANPVVIRSGHLINTNGPGRGAATLNLLGTLNLNADGANNFSTVTGSGTLRIGSALFPAGNYEAFVAANTGGTVDFTGPVQLPARDTYNNLTFSGANSKQLSNLDLTINGSLTTLAGTTVNNPTSQSLTLTSATSGATLGGAFNLNDGLLTAGAFLTNSGTLTLGAGAVGIGTAFTNSGTVNNGSGALVVGGAFINSGGYNANTGSGSLTANTFTNAGPGVYTAGTGSLTTTGNFSNGAGGTFTAASGAVTVGGSFANAGTYGVTDGVINNQLRVAGDFTNSSGGLFSAASSALVLQGNFTNSGTFDAGTGLVQFLTDASRTITGTTSFYNLQKLRTSPLRLGTGTDVTVNNLLTLQSGLIITGTANTLRLINTTEQPIVGTSPTAYVAGRLAMNLPNAASIREFPVGLGGRYRPVTIKPQGISAAPVVLVEIFNSPPAGPIANTLSNLSANRYYRIQLLSGTIAQPTVQLSFNTDVVDEEVNVPGNLRVARSIGNAGTWNTAGGAGVFSPEAPRGYTISAPTVIDNNSFFALASTNAVDNPLTGQAPLPVELVRFTATRQGPAVRLAWATATEKNSAYFSVQRASDGQRFTDIGRVEAQGNSSSRHDYALLDEAPLAGLNYYRLRQVDRDGTVAYSPVATVRFDGAAAPATPALLAYPNPASPQGFKLLTVNAGTSGGAVQLFDNVGRLVLTKTAAVGTAEVSIEPARLLASGMYFVTWQVSGGAKLTTKVVVE
ncbi:T9SS type A sorting domain-containing protein [uncultured Hymenobacter sp.]|uniref:T9SS type A sorting domain-containing protein n=1 Tax=uncultured Hymenobacter sp. TaxID=170016 RepID=UPI0035CADF85